MDNTPTDMSAALFAAIDSGDEARVMQLINAGADIFVTDADGLTTLTHARRQGNEAIISALEMMAEACGKEWEEPTENVEDSSIESESRSLDTDELSSEAKFLCERGYKLYDDGQHARALSCFRKAAENGCREAQYQMLNLFDKNDGTAIRFCRTAAEQGYVPAQRLLGLKGRQDASACGESELWLWKAAAQGDVEAALAALVQDNISLPDMEVLREALRRFPGIRKHPQYRVFERAIRGFSDAQRELAASYDKGRVVSRNSYLAYCWYRAAAEHGDAEAQFLLGERLRKLGEERKDASSLFGNAELYLAESAAWYIMAALQGRMNAYFKAGEVYKRLRFIHNSVRLMYPDEVFKSARYLVLAEACYKRGAELGSEEAKKALAVLSDEHHFPVMECVSIKDFVFSIVFAFLAAGSCYLVLSEGENGWSVFVGWLGVAILGFCAIAYLLAALDALSTRVRCRRAWLCGLTQPIERLDEGYILAKNDGYALEIKPLTIAPAPEEGL